MTPTRTERARGIAYARALSALPELIEVCDWLLRTLEAPYFSDLDAFDELTGEVRKTAREILVRIGARDAQEARP